MKVFSCVFLALCLVAIASAAPAPESIGDKIKGAFDKAKNVIGNAAEKYTEIAGKTVDAAKDLISGNPKGALDKAKNIVREGAEDAFGAAKDLFDASPLGKVTEKVTGYVKDKVTSYAEDMAKELAKDLLKKKLGLA